MAILHKDGVVSRDRENVVGKWWRIHNGLKDRGVKLGDWTGKTIDGRRAPVFSKRSLLADWFDGQDRG